MAPGGDFQTAFVRRSLQSVKTELEFLESTGHISTSVLQNILAQLPKATDIVPVDQTPYQSLSLTSLDINQVASNRAPDQHEVVQKMPEYPLPAGPPPGYQSEDQHSQRQHQQQQLVHHEAPSSYPPEKVTLPSHSEGRIATAIALYDYTSDDPTDLQLRKDDRVSVLKHENAEWSFGRSERTNLQGIFPRSYVRLLDESGSGSGSGPVQPYHTANKTDQYGSYGNMPMQVVTSEQQNQAVAPNGGQSSGKGSEMGKKFGKKLGNAAIFGAGATIGSNIVNSIF